MDINVIKTINWSECKDIILPLAGKCFGKPKSGTPEDFTALIKAYPAVNRKLMLDFLAKKMQRKSIGDITGITLVSEDSCLFSTESGSALEIIADYLRILNTGGRLPSLWCYLDTDEKAIIHFVNKSGWYAEAFFACNEDFSAMHLFSDGKETHFLPVVFTTNLAKYKEQAVRDGENCLRQYKPRELYSFLSNKSGKKKKKDTVPAVQRDLFPREKGDNL